MNIFHELLKYAVPNYPIFNYNGSEVKYALFYSSPAGPVFSDRLETIASIVRAKALKYRFEKKEKMLQFKDIILELCSDNYDLAEDIAYILNEAIRIDKFIEDINIRRSIDSDGLSININQETIERLVTGPIYDGFEYEKFLASAIDFQSEKLKEVFMSEFFLFFNHPIDFSNESATHTDILGESLVTLNQSRIYKSKTMDILVLPNEAYFPCVDVNKRFHDGDFVCSDSAWIFGQTRRDMSVVIVE